MIRLAGSTFAFGDISLEESTDLLQDLGFGLADVGASGWSTFMEFSAPDVIEAGWRLKEETAEDEEGHRRGPGRGGLR